MKIELLKKQTKNCYDWVNKLIDPIPMKVWDETPDVLESNISWQVGHLIVSTYFHSILGISGHQKSILKTIPLKRYSALFSSSAPKKSIGIIDPKELRDQLAIVHDKSFEILSSLSDDDLDQKLEPSNTPNPVASTKYEAIDWNIKHSMWHCGQLSILKRIVHKPYNFGLKKET